jgi:hypothetical protein
MLDVMHRPVRGQARDQMPCTSSGCGRTGCACHAGTLWAEVQRTRRAELRARPRARAGASRSQELRSVIDDRLRRDLGGRCDRHSSDSVGTDKLTVTFTLRADSNISVTTAFRRGLSRSMRGGAGATGEARRGPTWSALAGGLDRDRRNRGRRCRRGALSGAATSTVRRPHSPTRGRACRSGQAGTVARCLAFAPWTKRTDGVWPGRVSIAPAAPRPSSSRTGELADERRIPAPVFNGWVEYRGAAML